MACTASKTPFLRAIATRGFAAQASPKVASAKVNELQVTTLPNQTIVASIDGNSPLSHVSIAYRAGSRNESYEKQGTTHVLRAGAALSNANSTGFGVIVNVKATGGDLSVLSDRESIAYNVELKRDELPTGLKYLQDVATKQSFRPWELKDSVYRIKDDLARVPSVARAVDLLHQAAFYRGLGNSVFCAKRNVGKLSPEDLHSFVSNYLTADRAVVVGVGVDHELLCGYSKQLQLEGKSSPNTPSKYNASQLRVDKSGDLATVAIATQGASLANQKEAIAFAVLRNVAGCGPIVPYGSPSAALDKVVDAALQKPYQFNTLNVSYSDNGLFGFVLQANASEVGKAVDAAVKALKSGSVSQGDVDRAKAQLKVNIFEQLGTSTGRFEDLVAQAVRGEISGKSELIAAVDAISVADVNAAAKKVASGKWSIGAVGNLANVPHVNDLN
ncbi:cytochrome b-c1 complex subunit 2, mitochondrial [Contarinia nasturtii]|uniref:cytochrome b-c1 complex subunit 2, mitochondrial n=1 Tax=Contarinia nasturtii TaxID=265458 RepID=UPI0012D4B4C7|nr:cytochrome b-c1 complex subunit 2, mitochondrial [Contarinia nasturtii]